MSDQTETNEKKRNDELTFSVRQRPMQIDPRRLEQTDRQCLDNHSIDIVKLFYRVEKLIVETSFFFLQCHCPLARETQTYFDVIATNKTDGLPFSDLTFHSITRNISVNLCVSFLVF